jgi:hypothetical protein
MKLDYVSRSQLLLQYLLALSNVRDEDLSGLCPDPIEDQPTER